MWLLTLIGCLKSEHENKLAWKFPKLCLKPSGPSLVQSCLDKRHRVSVESWLKIMFAVACLLRIKVFCTDASWCFKWIFYRPHSSRIFHAGADRIESRVLVVGIASFAKWRYEEISEPCFFSLTDFRLVWWGSTSMSKLCCSFGKMQLWFGSSCKFSTTCRDRFGLFPFWNSSCQQCFGHYFQPSNPSAISRHTRVEIYSPFRQIGHW